MIPKSHPRYESLMIREKLIKGFEKGIVAKAGLIAHGRGEAFDYLLGEKTIPEAMKAIEAAAATLILAKHPVISVNGNVAALVPDEIVELSKVVPALLEINLFYRTRERIEKIKKHLEEHGASTVLGTTDNLVTIPELFSERRKVDPEGIYKADVVFVPLEDGDRTEALRRMGKIVITVDLNPMSRTARTANITIVDNIVRAAPLLIKAVKKLKGKPESELMKIVNEFDNDLNLRNVIRYLRDRLTQLSKSKMQLM